MSVFIIIIINHLVILFLLVIILSEWTLTYLESVFSNEFRDYCGNYFVLHDYYFSIITIDCKYTTINALSFNIQFLIILFQYFTYVYIGEIYIKNR